MHDTHSGGLSLWKWYNVSQLPNVTSLVYQPVDVFEDFTIRFLMRILATNNVEERNY